MDGNFIAMLIKDIAIPEIMAVVRAHHNAGLPPPTNEQIIAATEMTADRFASVGELFLRSLPEPAAAQTPLGTTNDSGLGPKTL